MNDEPSGCRASDTPPDIAPDTAERPPHPANEPRLLLKAIRTLPEAEQDAVLAYLLDRSLAPEGTPRPSPGVVARCTDPVGSISYATRAMSAVGAPYFSGGAEGTLRTMPVRFPQELYDRLKGWSGEHGFPMAVVVRGLVERFLDEQAGLRPPARPEPPTT